MIIRELDPAEWGRLQGHPLFQDVGVPDPTTTRILIAEDADRIIALWCLIPVVHLEPVWIDAAYRNGTVAGRLWAKMRVLLDHFHIPVAYCFADTSQIADYLKRLGLRELPYRTFVYDPKGQYPKDI